jgi:hypothetical protein
VTPYNALADDLKKGDNPVHEAITFHRLLGLLAHGEEAEDSVDEEGNIKVRGHDISGVTTGSRFDCRHDPDPRHS